MNPTPLPDIIAGFSFSPLDHALFSYPWGEGVLKDVAGPRAWQRAVMEAIGRHLADPATRHTPMRIAVASGHGIGKSALIAMIVGWALDTCEDTRILITANTEAQLRTKTAPEIAKWRRLALTAGWFRPTATALISSAKGHEQAWRADLVTWSAQNTEAFAGLHNQGRRIVVIYDEASGIADKVWEVTLGALTDAATEILWIAFGNPTQNSGAFRECFGRHRRLWHTAQIDSRQVEGTNRAYLDELAATYGEESDIVKVRVRGQFPAASSLQFISAASAGAARSRAVESLPSDPLIYGVDIARFGDDHSTLAKRCGRDARSRPWRRWHGADTMQVAGDIALDAAQERPDAIFVDAGAMGAGVVDRLRQLGLANVHEVHFGGKGREAIWAGATRVRTANKRAEMWTNLRAWLDGGAIPDEQAIEDDLTGLEYGYDGASAIMLEKKAHMKARGLASPDDGDALALTFAEPVMPRETPAWLSPGRWGRQEAGVYDRYAELRREWD